MVAKSDPLYLAVRMRRYGSLIYINPSGSAQQRILFSAATFVASEAKELHPSVQEGLGHPTDFFVICFGWVLLFSNRLRSSS